MDCESNLDVEETYVAVGFTTPGKFRFGLTSALADGLSFKFRARKLPWAKLLKTDEANVNADYAIVPIEGATREFDVAAVDKNAIDIDLTTPSTIDVIDRLTNDTFQITLHRYQGMVDFQIRKAASVA